MIFSIRDLSFELGSMLLEGWPAFAARAVCALLILLAAWLVRRWLTHKGFPALEARSWHFTGTPILLRSFAVPVQRMCTVVGIYLAASSLPWAIPGVRKLFLMAFQLVMTLLVCEGLYAASELADLVLASCSPEIRSNKTLLSLLNTTYKVLVIAVGVAAGAQEVGFPIGSIVAGAGLIGLTISLAAQESASNLFSGIVILLDKPFSVGDWITVGDVEGEVIDINFRSTRIRSPDKTVKQDLLCHRAERRPAHHAPLQIHAGCHLQHHPPAAGKADAGPAGHAGCKPPHQPRHQHRAAGQLRRFQHQHPDLGLPADQRLRRVSADAERPEPEHHGHHAG